MYEVVSSVSIEPILYSSVSQVFPWSSKLWLGKQNALIKITMFLTYIDGCRGLSIQD